MINSFEDFPVYKRSLELSKEIGKICNKIRNPDFFFLKDQLRRASSSIILNLAEGAGKWSKRDKANFYRISRGSAFETIAALDLVQAYQLISEEKVKKLKDKLNGITKDMHNLIISIERRKK